MKGLPLVEAAFLAFVAALFLTPLARRLAGATGYLDHPDPRKHHPRSTPLLGGVAVAAALLLGPLLARWIFDAEVARPASGVLYGAALALVLGLIDDRRPMRPMGKLLGQIAAGVTLVTWGGHGAFFLERPLLAAGALLYVVALQNAVNFLDAMDGIVATVAPIAAAGFLAIALLFGAGVDRALAWALVGGCAGFLVYNAPPARIFLGDAGSHLLGFALAALALQALGDSWTWPRVAAVACILSYPVFDVLFVIGVRLASGRPITVASTDHTTHRLGRICGRWGALGVLAAVSAVTAALGTWVWGLENMTVATAAVLVLGLGYALFARYLGRKRPTPSFDT